MHKAPQINLAIKDVRCRTSNRTRCQEDSLKERTQGECDIWFEKRMKDVNSSLALEKFKKIISTPSVPKIRFFRFFFCSTNIDFLYC